MKLKTILVFVLCFTMFFPCSSVFASKDISVIVSGEKVSFTDAKPFIDENNRTQLPLRAVAEALNCSVSWDPDENAATVKEHDEKGNVLTEIIFYIGIETYEVYRYSYDEGGALSGSVTDQYNMDTEPIIVNDRTFLPIRYLAQVLNYEVSWDSSAYVVRLEKAAHQVVADVIAGKSYLSYQLAKEYQVKETKPFMIDFDDHGDEEVQAIYVRDNSLVTLPTPDRYGHRFVYWCIKDGTSLVPYPTEFYPSQLYEKYAGADVTFTAYFKEIDEPYDFKVLEAYKSVNKQGQNVLILNAINDGCRELRYIVRKASDAAPTVEQVLKGKKTELSANGLISAVIEGYSPDDELFIVAVDRDGNTVHFLNSWDK